MKVHSVRSADSPLQFAIAYASIHLLQYSFFSTKPLIKMKSQDNYDSSPAKFGGKSTPASSIN